MLTLPTSKVDLKNKKSPDLSVMFQQIPFRKTSDQPKKNAFFDVQKKHHFFSIYPFKHTLNGFPPPFPDLKLGD